ncbi:MAG: OmpA family protein [Actinomycetota bacterium]|nr:OmpA family protein [Actinomycetota bacterium]
MASLVAVVAIGCGPDDGDASADVAAAPAGVRALPDVVPASLPALESFIPQPDGTKTATLSEDTFFPLGAAELTAEGAGLLASILPGLASHEGPITIEGYTDGLGSTEDNLALSAARAEAVKGWLVAHDVDPAAISTEGLGEDGAVDDIADPSRRKVVITLEDA